MSHSELLQRRAFGETSRKDNWWVQPLAIFSGLTAFIVYTTWAAYQGEFYFYHERGAHYLSPFYSPLFYGAAGEPRWIAAERPSWWPDWLHFSAAALILMGPAGMRFTCYYYRGSYYKAFWADPPACAVGEPRKSYLGEHRLPLILQNVHRYFFYVAVLFSIMLTYDGIRAFFFESENGGSEFGIGLGSIVLLANAILITGYTFSCHCSRHFFGGRHDCLSQAKVRKACYDCVSSMNRKHMQWAWVSLVSVMFADIYVRLCAMGIWSDWRML